MIAEYLVIFLGSLLAYVCFNSFTYLRIYQLHLRLKNLEKAQLSDVRRASVNKRWETTREMQELLDFTKNNKAGVNVPEESPDKWGDWLKGKT